MGEADEEHHVARLLIAELDAMHEAENVRHHIDEEVGEMLPRAQKVKLDFAALAERMTAREKFLVGGVPAVGAEAMVKAARARSIRPPGPRGGRCPSCRSPGREQAGGRAGACDEGRPRRPMHQLLEP